MLLMNVRYDDVAVKDQPLNPTCLLKLFTVLSRETALHYVFCDLYKQERFDELILSFWLLVVAYKSMTSE